MDTLNKKVRFTNKRKNLRELKRKSVNFKKSLFTSIICYCGDSENKRQLTVFTGGGDAAVRRQEATPLDEQNSDDYQFASNLPFTLGVVSYFVLF